MTAPCDVAVSGSFVPSDGRSHRGHSPCGLDTDSLFVSFGQTVKGLELSKQRVGDKWRYSDECGPVFPG